MLDLKALSEELSLPVEEIEKAYKLSDKLLVDLGAEVKTPEQWAQVVDDLKNNKGLEAELSVRGKLAGRAVDFDSFKHYYWCKYQFELPPIAYGWAQDLIEAFNTKGGRAIEAFRGATKTTVLRAVVEFLEGHHPVGNVLVIQINDAAAALAGQSMADTIKYSPGWKACFPHVVPDEERGWSAAKGYFLVDTTVVGAEFKETNPQYGRWIQLCIKDHGSEPQILTAGIESRDIVGKHPSNGVFVDDIHDENNTRSTREMSNVVAAVEANLLPVLNRPFSRPIVGMAYTPWNRKDGYQPILRVSYIKKSTTPIFTYDEKGKYELEGRRGNPTWPEAYPMEFIQEKLMENPVRFKQMYMCDIKAMDGMVLKAEWLHEFPFESISPSWPVYFGIDFASTADYTDVAERDYFALAVVRVNPSGGAVLVDGIREHLSQGDAETRVKALADVYHPVNIGVEKWGRGDEFLSLLTRMSSLPVIGCPYKGTPVKSKGQRFETGLAPMFTTGRAYISDHKNKFIDHFKMEWISWDGDKQKSRTGHDDALDAVYYAFYVSGSHLVSQPEPREDLTVDYRRRKTTLSPWSSLGEGYR